MHVFVTGTDTGIGKTFVSTLLALKSKRSYWKPIQSGVSSPTDSEWVAQHISKEKITPEIYRLTEPLSPHLSARLDGVQISVQKILNVYKNISTPTIIEGAGGLLVPLNKKDFMIDLIKEMRCPVLLVARSTLGTINHTLLSIAALRSRDMSLLGVILTGEPNTENKRAIEEYGNVKVLAEIPWFSILNKDTVQRAAASLSEII